jgi:hypothetical protein
MMTRAVINQNYKIDPVKMLAIQLERPDWPAIFRDIKNGRELAT